MSEHKGNTGKVNKVNLESSIDRVIWTSGTGCVGAKVGIEVNTHFVGINSEIKIDISDKSGKKFETVKGKISGNHFWYQITVPEKAKDELYAEVKLTKHSLTKKSNALNLYPPIQIKNLKWDKKEIRRGDTLKLSAEVSGIYDGAEAEIQIWENDADGAHELIAEFPYIIKNGKVNAEWEFQYLGKTDDISTSYESENGYQHPQYYFRIKVAEVYGDSELLKFTDCFEIKLVDYDGNPVKNIDYELYLPNGEMKKGKLDEDGYAKIEDVPPGKYEVKFPYIKGSNPEYNPHGKGNYTYKAD